MVPSLSDLSLHELEARMGELDEWGRASESEDADYRERVQLAVFARGGSDDDDWNNYHRVRNEYDRRASEEFDLGQ